MSEGETEEQTAKRIELEIKTRDVADEIEKMLPPDSSFMLMFAGVGDGYKNLTWVSNTQRESAIEMMRELLERWGANQ